GTVIYLHDVDSDWDARVTWNSNMVPRDPTTAATSGGIRWMGWTATSQLQSWWTHAVRGMFLINSADGSGNNSDCEEQFDSGLASSNVPYMSVTYDIYEYSVVSATLSNPGSFIP